jgi:energy-coupling factor transporter ATP-binding protein EcfA2
MENENLKLICHRNQRPLHFLRKFRSREGCQHEDRKAEDHRHHRSFGLRQIHPVTRLQPHERLCADQPRAKAKFCCTENLYSKEIDPVEVRRRIGMVFQKPNPFPKSIYENIAWGARINGFKGNMDELVEQSLRGAALWDEVKDKLKKAPTPSPAGSSSACASPAPSPSSPKSS